MKKNKRFNYYVVFLLKKVGGTSIHSAILHLQNAIARPYDIEKIEKDIIEEFYPVGRADEKVEIIILSWTLLGEES